MALAKLDLYFNGYPLFHQPQGDTKTRADKLHHSLRMVVIDYSTR